MNPNDLPSAPRSCVAPHGRFIYGIHQPAFRVANMRPTDRLDVLGWAEDGRPVTNQANFPIADVHCDDSQEVYEIPNALPFRGTTYIGRRWADRNAADPSQIGIEKPFEASLCETLRKNLGHTAEAAALIQAIVQDLPPAFKLAVAATSNDPADLITLARTSCEFISDSQSGAPLGLAFERSPNGALKPRIHHARLFELVANNPHLPDNYKQCMVLKPGIQGDSKIVGEWRSPTSHVYEYLRRNSYIAGGHYAANMADDSVCYDVGRLNAEDIYGLRHLYYQRTYIRLGEELELHPPDRRRTLSPAELDHVRNAILRRIRAGNRPLHTSTLWGWNYGFDYAPSGYRLHGSHQQIHQQYALIPERVPSPEPGQSLAAYSCGDLVAEFSQSFKRSHAKCFFDCYLQAIAANQRMDDRPAAPHELKIHADDSVILFVPKAQTSQWELQLMTLPKVGNILEADATVRHCLDRAMLLAMRILRLMGADMVTVIEYSKRFHSLDQDQRLFYSFLPRLPESPGTFSEAQLRWINGHYPEDFAAACRLWMESCRPDNVPD